MFEHIFNFDFVKAIQDNGGEVYLVGGCVRDMLLNRKSKDIDLIVLNVPMNDLQNILSSYGKFDLVGESFSVIKFKHNDIVYDIALPRIDTKIIGAKGHKSIEVQSDHTISLKEDMRRRDFTVNALAVDKNNNIIDYFNGQEDIENKIIRCVSESSFIDDPLRMLRAIQFSPRFNFTIEPNTYSLIKKHVSLIKEITMERIFEEFQKPFNDDGNIELFINLLRDTCIFEYIFGLPLRVKSSHNTKQLSELLFFALPIDINKPTFYKKFHPSMSDKIFKDLKAFDIIFDVCENTYHKMFKALQYSDIVLKTLYITPKLKTPFINNVFPKSKKEIALSGDDLKELGFKEGKEIGVLHKNMLEAILDSKVSNNKDSLIKYIR